MGFTYEDQESSKFLVYQSRKTDNIDNAVVGIASGSQINGVLRLVPVRIDGELFFKYNITGLSTLKEYLSGYVEKKRLLDIMENLTDIFADISKYMLDAGDFILDSRYIFVDPSAVQCYLVALPVEKERIDVKTFFNNLISGISIDMTKDNMVGELLQFLHPSQSFSLESFQMLIRKLRIETASEAKIMSDSSDDEFPDTEDPDATVLMDDSPTVLSGPKLLCLRTQKSFRVSKEMSSIGRNPAKNDFCIEGNPEIGRESHASILWRSGELYIRDNHSHNGVFVDGQRIEQDKWYGPLKNGIHFCLAREEFEVQLEENIPEADFSNSIQLEDGSANGAGFPEPMKTEERQWKNVEEAESPDMDMEDEKNAKKKGFLSLFTKKEKKVKEPKEKKKGKEKKKAAFGNFSIPDKGEK